MMKEKLEQFDAACARAEELVTYLYGEAGEQEAAEFRRHLHECAACSQEMAAFSRVREDVVEWRNLSLPSFEFSQAVAPVALEQASARQNRSALAALRQFFTLAPAWMRAATAMAALLVCALVVFTALYFSEQSGARLQVATEDRKEARPELNVKNDEELRKQEPQQVKEAQATLAVEDGSVEAVDNRPTAPPANSRRQTASPAVARQNRATPDKVKASQAAREQLAELVQASNDEDGLPRLSDLIEDGSGSN